MAFATVLLCLVTIYVRPGEVIPGWEGFPFAAIALGIATVAMLVSLVFQPRRFWNQPQDRYVFGFFVAAIISNPSWGWFGGAIVAFNVMAPTVLCYYLLRASVVTSRQLRWVGYTLVLATLFQAANGIYQYRSGVSLVGASAIEANVEATDNTEESIMRRIRGTGIFNDPNDLAMAFVGVVPFLLGPILRRRTRIGARLVAAALLTPLITALFYTNSRGGILGLGAALVASCWRIGRVAGIFVAALGLAVLIAIGPSRMGQLDSDETSAQGRIQSWSAGLQMLKSRPILGVGFGRYTEFNDLVAHNSFVHTLGEVGLIGGFMFVGMIYWLLRSTTALPAQARVTSDGARLSAFGDDLHAGALGLCVCALFLSRQYNIVLFIWIALSACYRQMAQSTQTTDTSERMVDVAMIGASTLGGIVAVYVIVRVLALWGG
jgi:hypothetical protein